MRSWPSACWTGWRGSRGRRVSSARAENRLTPQEFADRWGRINLTERASAQPHSIDLCRMLGQRTPTEADPDDYVSDIECERGLAGTKTQIGEVCRGSTNKGTSDASGE